MVNSRETNKETRYGVDILISLGSALNPTVASATKNKMQLLMVDDIKSTSSWTTTKDIHFRLLV